VYLGAAFLANLLFDLLWYHHPGLATLFAFGDCAESAAGAWLARRFLTVTGREGAMGETLALAVASILAGSLSATVGVLAMGMPVGSADVAGVWTVWWAADLTGIVIFTPLMVVAARPRIMPRRSGQEVAGLILVSAATAWGGFSTLFAGEPQFEYLIFPPLIWAAFRFGARGTAVVGVVVVVLALALSLNEVAFFPGGGVVFALGVLRIQLFLGVLVFIALILAVVVEDREMVACGTRRKEEQFRLLSEHLRAIIDTSPAAIVEIDALGRVGRIWNRAAEALFGWSQEEIAGHVPPIAPPGAEQEYARLAAEVLSGRELDGLPFTCARKDGVLREVSISTARITGRDGTPPGVVAIVADQTEMRRAERGRRTLSAAVEQSLTGVVVTSPQGVIEYVNRRYREITGYASEEVIGRIPWTLDFGAPPPDLCGPIKAAIREGREWTGEFQVRTRTAGTLWLNARISPVVDERRTVTHYLFVHEDVTVRKEAELALRTSRDTLERLTKHLEEVREEERAVVAREVHDELGQILTAVKLDFSGFIAAGSFQPEEVARRARSILSSLDGGIHAVQSISQRLRPRMLDDLGLVAALEWLVEDFEKRSGVRCAISCSPEDFRLDREPSTVLFRILQEALTNAGRHARASTVTVSLEQQGDVVELVVSDDGVGLPPEALTSPFSLGLTGMRERLRPLGGTLDIVSRPGGGTRLCARLSGLVQKPDTGAPTA
jgi:PAS domain S-box-containing protein